MRYLGLALTGVLLAGAVGQGQQPVQQPPAGQNPAPNRLDALLLQWEQSMRNVQMLVADVTRTTVDKVFSSTDVMEGTARYMKPNLAALHLVKKNRPEVFERFVCSGNHLYEFNQQNKEVRVHELPPPKAGQVAEDNFLSFLFGMKAEEAKRRYELKLENQDQHWVYIRIYPRDPKDQADFIEAQMVLSAATFLPRRLWFQQPNKKTEVIWDIPRIDPNARVDRNEFGMPQLPQGWTFKRVPRLDGAPAANQPPPRIVRPNGQ